MRSSGQTAPGPENTHLVILGASYALDWGEPALPGYRITNKGIGGEESSALRERFVRDVLAATPDAVLIWGHINDLFRSPRDRLEDTKQRVRDNYRAMHALAREAGIEVIIATEVTMALSDGWTDKLMRVVGSLLGKQDYREMINTHVRELNAWLREYAEQQRLTLLDFERALDTGDGSRRTEFAREDGSHITTAGYTALTEAAIAALTAASARD